LLPIGRRASCLFLSQSAHAALAQELHGLIDSETESMATELCILSVRLQGH